MFRSSLPAVLLPDQRGRCRSTAATGCLSDLSTAASPSCSTKPQGLQYRHSLAEPTSEPTLKAARPWMLSRRRQAFDFPSLRWEHIRLSSIAPRKELVPVELSSRTSAYLLLAWSEVCCLVEPLGHTYRHSHELLLTPAQHRLPANLQPILVPNVIVYDGPNVRRIQGVLPISSRP